MSFSGGKDSTAMLHMMLERGEDVTEIVWFDTGWEFPAMYEHVGKVEQNIGRAVTRLYPNKPFDYWLMDREVIARTGEHKGQLHRKGYGWASLGRRWCTAKKRDTFATWCNRNFPQSAVCVGFAADEAGRAEKDGQVKKYKGGWRYPLIEWGVSEAEALAYCKRLGYDWGGLYDIFPRVSCYCCPLKSLPELRSLRKHFPGLWQRMLDMDDSIQGNRGFRGRETVHDLEKRFAAEDADLEMKG